MVRKFIRVKDVFLQSTKLRAKKLSDRLEDVGFKTSIKKIPFDKRLTKKSKYAIKITGGKRKVRREEK